MKYFGTDGVRGIFGRDITPELVRALVRIIIEKNAVRVAVGSDTRAGGVFISDIILGELSAAGVTAVNFGVVTTAQLSFLTVNENADYGIMVTASHNDYKYNGIKLFNAQGQKLDASEMERFDGALAAALGGGGALPLEAADAWCEYLCGKFAELRGWATPPYIIIDAGHGAGAGNARAVLERLGFSPDGFEIINDSPDGFNINANCGAVYPRGLLSAVRKKQRALRRGVLGFAFDGDADRCVAVSARGVLAGDKLIALLAGEEERIVATKIFNPGVEDSMVAEVIKSDVGDHFVFDAMIEHGVDFGGETSGHIIDRRIWHSGDGLVTALMLLIKLKQNPHLLRTRIKVMPSLSKTIPITPADKPKFENAAAGGGVIIRPSGTENVLRITVFAKTKFACRLRMKRAIMFAKNLIKH